jgi:peptidoglycan hydrolase CwlO-like protein
MFILFSLALHRKDITTSISSIRNKVREYVQDIANNRDEFGRVNDDIERGR